MPFLYLVPGLGILALLYTWFRSGWVSRQDAGDARMRTIAGYIADGAIAFLKAEYRVLAIFGLIASAFLYYLGVTGEKSSPVIVVAFLIGAVFSALAGFIGMKIATKANVRTAQAARTSLSKALNVSFSGRLGDGHGRGRPGGAGAGVAVYCVLPAVRGEQGRRGQRHRDGNGPGSADGLLTGRREHCPVCAGRRRHLHQGRRRGRRLSREGRSRHSRG